jgi:hypothetical protein
MLRRGDVVKLVRVIAETREVEIGCDECIERLDSFAEAKLYASDETAAMALVGDHLDKCEDCRDELKALLTALRGT